MAPLLDDMPGWRYKPNVQKLTSWFPRKCEISGESLWLKKAYRVRYYGWDTYEDCWFCEREYLWKTLKDS